MTNKPFRRASDATAAAILFIAATWMAGAVCGALAMKLMQ
jgi:archaellum component FlaG (FlaF/FlaG flagellin family)